MTTRAWIGEYTIRLTATVIVSAANRAEAEMKLRNRCEFEHDIEDLDNESVASSRGRITREWKGAAQ